MSLSEENCVLWVYLTKLTFLGGPICGGGAITDFYGI